MLPPHWHQYHTKTLSALTRQLESTLNLGVPHASLIAKAAGRDLHKICPFNLSSSQRNLVLSSLFRSNAVLQVERAGQDNLVCLPHQPQDFPDFDEVWNHPKKVDILFFFGCLCWLRFSNQPPALT